MREISKWNRMSRQRRSLSTVFDNEDFVFNTKLDLFSVRDRVGDPFHILFSMIKIEGMADL